MELKLPLSVVGRFDVVRLQRELASLEEFFVASASRPAGTSVSAPKLSQKLDELAQANNCNLLDVNNRKTLTLALGELMQKAPMLHISFAAEPSPRFTEKILMWFRTNVHPQSLLQIGLQPSIAAGCMLRTTNRWFDMSLGSRLQQQHDYLVKLINEGSDAK